MEPILTLIDAIPFWGWWALAIVLMAFELILPTTHMLWPAVAAILTGILSLVLGDPFPAWQLAAFAVLTVIAALIGPRLLQPTYEDSDHPQLNLRGARVVGETALVVEDFAGGRGKVRLGDSQWLATAQDGSNPATGSRVAIIATKGTELIVRTT